VPERARGAACTDLSGQERTAENGDGKQPILRLDLVLGGTQILVEDIGEVLHGPNERERLRCANRVVLGEGPVGTGRAQGRAVVGNSRLFVFFQRQTQSLSTVHHAPHDITQFISGCADLERIQGARSTSCGLLRGAADRTHRTGAGRGTSHRGVAGH